MIDAFEAVAGRGTALAAVSSVAGHYASLSPGGEAALATVLAEELLSLPVVTAVGDDSLRACVVAKSANHVRVEAAALAWNLRGARINTVSPGVISTAISKAETESPYGGHMLKMLDDCGSGRTGTPGEIADAAALLTGLEAKFITGTDLLVAGGHPAGSAGTCGADGPAPDTGRPTDTGVRPCRTASHPSTTERTSMSVTHTHRPRLRSGGAARQVPGRARPGVSGQTAAPNTGAPPASSATTTTTTPTPTPTSPVNPSTTGSRAR